VTAPDHADGSAAPPGQTLRVEAGQEARSQTLAVRVALVVALVCLLLPGLPAGAAILSAIACVGLLAASARWSVGRAALIVLVLTGVALRLQPPTGFSDVLVVTEAAIRETLAGGNPYGHGFEASIPPGAPFPYGPLALLWYLPVLDDPRAVELWASLAVLIALGVRGQPVGLAIYAVMPALLATVSDGSNDHSVGLLLLVALLTAVRWPIGGAVLLALVTAFKPYALAWLPGLIGFAGIAPLVAFVVASATVWALPVLAWGADSILWSFRRADAIHEVPYYSLASALGGQWLPQPAWQALRIIAGLLMAIVALLWSRTAGAFIVLGTLVFGATLFLGWWSTFAYFAAVAPVLCWHLDGWLGLDAGRVAWPGDPVARVTTWVDRAWPIRHPGHPPSVIESSTAAR
jgi:hypothetical protein